MPADKVTNCLLRSSNPIDDRKPVLRREMAVARRHRDRLVASEFLNLFDRCSGHRQPGAEGVPIGVPDIVRDLRLFQTWLEPGSRVESALRSLTGKHRIRCLPAGSLQRFNCPQRISVEMDGPR